MKTPASIREALEREHATLTEELRGLERSLDGPPRNGAVDTVQRLASVQARLTHHFAFEEQDGYMAHVLQRSPHAHRVVEELLSEHRQLAQSLATLLEDAHEAANGGELGQDFRHRVHEWVVRVHRHEARENLLVQESYGLDLAAED